MSASESESGTLNGPALDRLQRRLRGDLERDPDTRDHRAPIFLLGEEVGEDEWLRVGHRGAQLHPPPRRRLDQDRAERVARVGRRVEALVEEDRGGEMELDVGRRQAVAASGRSRRPPG